LTTLGLDVPERAAIECAHRASLAAGGGCEEEWAQRLARVMQTCRAADTTASSHTQRCPPSCHAALNELRGGEAGYEEQRRRCYELHALLAVPYNPRFKVATMEGEPGKGCSVNNVNTGYDALGQPVLTQTYYHNCNCHAACQAGRFPLNSAESYANVSARMEHWSRFEALCEPDWFARCCKEQC